MSRSGPLWPRGAGVPSGWLRWSSAVEEPRGPSVVSFRGSAGAGGAEGCAAGALLPDSWLCCSVSAAAPAPDGRSPLQGSGMAAAPIPDPCGSWLLPQHPPQSAGEVQRPRLSSIPPIPPGFSPIRAPWKAQSPQNLSLQPFPTSWVGAKIPPLPLSRGCRGRSRGCRKLGSARGAQQQQQGLAEPTKQSRVSISH